MAYSVQDYKTEAHNDWCPGCGDFGILNALQMAFAEMQLEPHQTMVFSGIGCSGKTSHFVNAFGVHTLHGRSIPFASGAKISNPDLEVVVAGGDGDGYGIGVGHLVNSGRRNLDLAYVVFNNAVYGLTKGQAAPTLPRGAQPKSLPLPNINDAVNPLALALTAGFTWIGRGYAYDVKGLRDLIVGAIRHRGAAILDVLQPCPTYNDLHTKEYWNEKVETERGVLPRILHLTEEGYDGKVSDPADLAEVGRKRLQAFERVTRVEERTPLGVFYAIDLPTYNDRLADRLSGMKVKALARMPIANAHGAPAAEISHIVERFAV